VVTAGAPGVSDAPGCEPTPAAEVVIEAALARASGARAFGPSLCGGHRAPGRRKWETAVARAYAWK
jgi:hypothetical protein